MRLLSSNNLYQKKHRTFEFEGVWAKTMGSPEKHGAWLIWGYDKNGKTRFALKLAEYLSQKHKVLYISAEEGTDKAFVDACAWAGIAPKTRRVHFLEYESIDTIMLLLQKRRTARIVIIDNITLYNDELKNGMLRKLIKNHPTFLFIFLAHESRNEPYTATAKMCHKLAKIIVHIKGSTAFISGRCPGGEIPIDSEKSILFHGTPHLNAEVV